MRLEEVFNAETFVTSVVFNEDHLEVTFLEKNDQSPYVMLAKTMAIPINNDDEERVILLAEIQENLADLVERGYRQLRESQEPELSGINAIHRRMTGD